MATDAPRIAPIAPSDVRRIAGAQVVPDMRSAVKELIENALDAGATSIELRFKEYGLGGIEVVDNGSGIRRDDYAMIGRRHHTSKLMSFDDLTRVTTFGFRGEALASLCSVADVTMLTATEKDAPMGTLLEFAHDGSLKACDKRIARQRGTSVTLLNLLSGLPVRRRELEKNVKREFAKAHAMIQSYALVSEGVRWASSVLLADGKRVSQLVVRASSGPQYLQANMAALFGTKASAAMQSMNLDLSDDDHDDDIRMLGLVSKPAAGSGRSSGDRQYFYLNGRPWECPKLAHIFNQVYRTFNATQFPCVIADLRLGRHAYDVNVSPDKRTLYLHEEAVLLERIRVALEQVLEPSRSILHVQNQAFESTPTPSEEAPKRSAPEATRDPPKSARTETCVSTLSASWSSPPVSQDASASQGVSSMRAQFRQAVQNFAMKRAQLPDNYVSEYEEEGLDGSDIEDQPISPGSPDASLQGETRHRSPMTTPTTPAEPENTVERPAWQRHKRRRLPETPIQAQDLDDDQPNNEPDRRAQIPDVPVSPGVESPPSDWEEPARPADCPPASCSTPQVDAPHNEQDLFTITATSVSTESSDELDEEAQPSSPVHVQPMNTQDKGRTVQRSTNRSSLSAHTVILPFDFQKYRGRLERAPTPCTPRPWQGAEVGVPDQEVVAALERVLAKPDFSQMHVVGQFNLGFIIARRTTPDMDDLFIIDQHAADEKFNFETLQRTTKIHSQQLLRPQPVELAPTDELVAMEHAEWLRINGFDVSVDEEAAPGHRIKLLSKPVSKDTVFDLHDFEELLFQLRETQHGQACRARCTKVYDMLASRACRKSIMVGSALDLRQMRQVLQHMSETEQPWNCPHGRPTIRHLTTLGTPSSARPVAWSALSLL
ncbi:Similar to S.cerevisiae protein PMS1 (ATP-binding protein required for mismatch repair) [Malassezia sympodialis ATCC 42132]|uniref:Similar to S.cerevisiae protein PMS1 (ATP-binding protein required for mismatch repair) n=1 Tax=Malassezia sympodialis (strain ATCC 42132) TaxID=1230383 RepID=A0A1M8AAS2_MALS4|nr:Similar to S.cerevisiae protein PMS1 (ATP-binding protein required for mismatch repair) [Malassezia sympodialis ATCC 42132]